jgi:hypothetical protein
MSTETTPEIERLIGQCLGHIERMDFSPDRRAGVRCGAGDAATICMVMAHEMRKGRKSKLRTAMADLADKCAEQIMAYYHRVEVHRRG